MSFSSDTKDALAREQLRERCCGRAELSAFLHLAGDISLLGRNRRRITVTTESQVIARRVYGIVKELYGFSPELAMKENKRLNKKHTFLISVNDEGIADRILSELGILKKVNGYDNLYLRFDESLIAKRCCKESFLRASFLAAGSLSNPEKFYHMEFSVRNDEYAAGLVALLEGMSVRAKIVMRKGSHVVYIKGADQISTVLTHIGAIDAMLSLENIRVLKEVRNNVNRAVNCENANVDKMLRAAGRQLKNINYIKDNMGFEKLPVPLRQAAELRLSNPYAPLSELCAMMTGEVGKSGLSHRFRKLEMIADKIREEKGEVDD